MLTPGPELEGLRHQELGVSRWLEISQDRIDAFADVTGDHQWIHVDVERAATAAPLKTTVAHGYLLLSLLPQFAAQVYGFVTPATKINYGLNRVRFPSPVPAGGQVRDRIVLADARAVSVGVELTLQHTLELKAASKPVCVAETVTVIASS